MKPGLASQTAVFAAANRALESEKPADKRICFDPLARKLIGPLAYWRFKASRLLQQRRGYTLQSYVLYRCRYFDEYLRTCLKAGIAQVVILGAGWDSRAYRGDLLDRGITTFEVDHPATQAEKIRAIKRIFRTVLRHVTYVPLDFRSESLDKLTACGFNPSLRTLFLWEGVTYYLNDSSVDTVLAWIRAHAAENSAVILDYMYPYQSTWARRRTELGKTGWSANPTREWRKHGVRKERAEELLARHGFVRIWNVPAEELPDLYGPGWHLGRWGMSRHAIVSAEVGAP